MKLVIAIIHDEDSHDLIKTLTKNDYGVTKLASTGGFLKAGNTTILVGTQKEKVDEVISIIKDTCKTRKEITTTAPMVADTTAFVSIPIEVQVGGATIFVVDVDRFEKV